jgi:hypothetical protein
MLPPWCRSEKGDYTGSGTEMVHRRKMTHRWRSSSCLPRNWSVTLSHSKMDVRNQIRSGEEEKPRVKRKKARVEGISMKQTLVLISYKDLGFAQLL